MLSKFITDVVLRQQRWGLGKNASRRRSSSRGVQTIELLVTVPVMFFALVGMVQYGVQTLIQQAVTQAATAAAREAGKGASLSEVVATVNLMLDPHDITVTNVAGSLTGVILETSDSMAVTTTSSFIDPGLTCSPPALALGANEARVTVCIGLTLAPFLNALPSVGFDTTGKTFEISSLVQKE